MSDNSTIFAGSSRYAGDLSQVLQRSIAIASLPLSQLNNQLSTLQSRSSGLESLDGKFNAILTALQNLSSAVINTSATVSDPSVVTAHSDPAALPGSYTVHVISPGSPTTTLSNSGLPSVQDPSSQSITSSGSLTLTVDGSTFTITPAANSLNALADAINSSGAEVTATILNLGSPSAPNYQLALTSKALGNVAIQLNDGSQDLLSTLAAGTEAQYQVNGLPATPISSNSRTVTIAPGLTVDLLQAGDATIEVSRTPSALADALSSFISAYNAAVDELNKNRGQAGGPLTGDAMIYSLSQSLRDLTGFTGGSNAVQNLTDLGLTFDKFGKLSLDQDQFNSVSVAHASDVAAFLGSPSTGGFLKTATDILNGLEDPVTGTMHSVRDRAQQAIDNQNKRIAAEEDRIEILRANLMARMAAADALIASLEQQVNYFTTLFESMNGTQNR